MKTKKQLVVERIVISQEEVLNMEIVRDYNASLETPEAKVQVDAANDRIKKTNEQLTWLTSHLETLE